MNQAAVRFEAESNRTLINREPFDYTEWRKGNLFVGESVDSLTVGSGLRPLRNRPNNGMAVN